jgi:hypothetical protein
MAGERRLLLHEALGPGELDAARATERAPRSVVEMSSCIRADNVDGRPDMNRTPITANSSIDEVLTSYPETGAILIQSGHLYRARKGNLYLEYPPLTIADYAALNRLDLSSLLRRLEAAAEIAQASEPFEAPRPSDSVRRGSAIGYTGAYRDPGDLDVRDVVAVQNERGPD